MSELLFKELEGLKGGQKQAWVSAHLDLIWELNNSLGFEATRLALGMKVDTLYRALQRAERGSSPALTESKRALLKAQSVEAQVNELSERSEARDAELERKLVAIGVAVEWLEKVLTMLKLALGGEAQNDKSRSEFTRGPHSLYVTSSKIQSAPLLTTKRSRRISGSSRANSRALPGQGGAP